MSDLQKNWIGLGLLTLGIAFAVLGVLRGEQDTVYIKAVNICMECIGLG